MKNQKLIITIDGPAGAGKSTIAQMLAKRLDIDYLDTGALYRTVTYAALEAKCPLDDNDQLVALARACHISFNDNKVFLNNTDVTDVIRSATVSDQTHYIARNTAIRAIINQQQLAIGNATGALITEGRDQGSVVFSNAPFKFYLDAHTTQRAQRRYDQMCANAPEDMPNYDTILAAIKKRDLIDSTREVDPLTIPYGAITIDSTHMTPEEVVDKMCAIVNGEQS
jgi:cytidylate kinase